MVKAYRKGDHTKPNVWDKAAALSVRRAPPDEWLHLDKLDPGVNFFVLMLEQQGIQTHYSCEGHPDGFYVTFSAPYETALGIKKLGYFTVEIEEENYWSIRKHPHPGANKADALRWAADAWERGMGPLDWSKVHLLPE